LGADNKVLQEGIQHKMEAEKKEPCDAKLYDFDDIFYRIYIDPDNRSKMLISLELKNWDQIKTKGSEDYIKLRLEKYIKNWNDNGVSFEINLDDEKCASDALNVSQAFSKLRIYALGGPMYSLLNILKDGKAKDNDKSIDYKFRPDTHLWCIPKKDRLACVFAFEFPIKSDRIIANQVLSEFVEVRRMKEVSNTPVVAFSKDAPSELKDQKIPKWNEESFLGYFTVLILPEHIKTQQKLDTAVENLVGFRAYLTYHIKCAKAFFHQSMRARAKTMLQVLNRARYEEDDARKKKKIIVGADR